MFQANLQGWRRLAASLALVPGLTGLGVTGLGLASVARADDRPAAVVKADEARDLMRQARDAYDAKNYGKAKELAEKARSMRAPSQFFDDTPEDLLADIAKKSGGKSGGTAKPTTTDPRKLLGMARQSLESGDLDKAQDFASMAQANEGTVRWGLFDDTPASMLKDIQKAKTKRDQRQAEKLVSDARNLLDRQAADKNERAKNVSMAEEKARQAAKLHGPYSVWDFGDRPEEIVADARKIRQKESLSTTKPVATESQTARSKPAVPERAKPAVRESMKPADDEIVRTSKGPSKAEVVALMKEASALKIAGNYPAAREKLILASQANVAFSREEDSPETELSKLNGLAQRSINTLCSESKQCMARNDVTTAKTKLEQAGRLAASMNLDSGAVREAMAAMPSTKTESGIAKAANSAGSDSALDIVAPPIKTVGGSEKGIVTNAAGSGDPALIPAPITPPLPNVAAKPANVVKEPVPALVTPAVGEKRGQILLDQARVELKKDNTETARRLVIEVINGQYGLKEEAAALLNTIEAEESERKMFNARRAFENGMAAMNAQNYASALAIFQQIDPMLLNAKNRTQLTEMTSLASARQKAQKDGSALVTGGADIKTGPTPQSGSKPSVGELPGAVATPKVGADNLIKQQEALTQVEFQQLRTQGLKIESEATARFGKGETDAALLDLQNYVAKVRGSSLDSGKQNLLVRPIEARMERLKILKHQTDFLTKERTERTGFRAEMTQEALTRKLNQEEVARLMKASGKLMDEGKYTEAYAQVQKAHAIDSDDPSINASMKIIKTMMRKREFERVKSTQEEDNFNQLNELMEHPLVTGKDPLKVSSDKETIERILKRPDYSNGIGISRSRTEKEKEIERKLSTPITVTYKGETLESVVADLAVKTNLNFDLDLRGLKDGGVDPKQPIKAQLTNVSLKSALNIITQQAGLKHVIENETIRVTTSKNAAGRQMVRTIPVGDLVVPAPNFGAAPGLSLPEALMANQNNGLGGGTSTLRNRNGLPAGSNVSDPASGAAGKLMNQPLNGGAASDKVGNGTLEKELIRMITTTIKPESWMQQGGEGTIEYYPLGLAMVINQSPEVIEEVERLLESLRKLQDLEVSIEVKVVALGETFYERIGVDFAMGVRTNATPNASGPNSVIGSLSNANYGGNVIGLQTPGVATPDLSIPIRATSFGKAVPPFGGFSNSFADGGVSLGLAFLSDIQVQMFLEAAQGDTRTNVLQAPKITSLNGTAAIISVNDFQFFNTGMQVTSVGGQLVYTPQNIPFPVGTSTQTPGGGSILNPTPSLTSNLPGITLSVQPVVSADRRFVRMNIQQSFVNLISGTAQVPITTIITPVFENGGQGQPTPFTQFLQQPRFSSIDTQTVVVVPDGGTVVMGGLKYMSEGRNEFGPPVLSKVPYLNRLFKNVSYGREGRSILLMVTPRIIINREEQQRQTGVNENDEP